MAELTEDPAARDGANRAGACIHTGNECLHKGQREDCKAHPPWRYVPTSITLWLTEFYELAQKAGVAKLIEFIREHGLDHKALNNLGITPSILPVKFAKNRFDFAYPNEGEWACVFEIIEEQKVPPHDLTELVVVDLVAFSVSNPAKFATAIGRARGLGLSNVENPASSYKIPLRVWKTPLQWLQKECAGCVILDNLSAPSWLSECPGDISGETLEHSRQIARMLHGLIDMNRIHAPLKVL